MLCLWLTDHEEGDEDEPDLPLLTTLDFAALKDVRQTGQEYCRQFEALLHNTPSLEPGYLPEADASYLFNGLGHRISMVQQGKNVCTSLSH